MTSILISITAFVFVLSVLITVHEFGHYWVARKCGVKVLRFSVGFGNPLWKRVAGADKTEYVVAAIPLGGYVKMLDEREGKVEEHEVHRAFNRQSVGKRFAIVSAGPLFNFFFAIVAYWLMFNVGMPGLKPYIDHVDDGSIAARADVRAGDEVVAVDGRDTPTWQAVRQELLSRAVDHTTTQISLRSEQGVTRDVALDFAALKRDLQDARIIEQLGIKPIEISVPAVIGSVLRGQAAEQAGLKIGDRIVTADDREIHDWTEWVTFVRDHPGATVALRIERDGSMQGLELRIGTVEENGKAIGRIGAAAGPPPDVPEEWKATLRYGPVAAVGAALHKTWDMSALTVLMMWKMVVGEVSVDNLSGPITIAKYAGYTAKIGLSSFLSFLAIISVSLGVLNLLPVPMLDGGHLMYYLIEIVKGRPLSDQTQLNLQRIGIVLLVMLMSLALYNDVARLLR